MHRGAERRTRRDGPEAGAIRDSCLSEDLVLGFVEGRLDKRQISRADRHLSACPSCASLVVEALTLCEIPVPSAPSGMRCLAFEPGACVAQRYLIRRLLGNGGMGDVYEAHDLELEQSVALKTARASGCDRPDVSRRLAEEVKLARRVCHPNVCRVHDMGLHHDPRPHDAHLSFITMDLIEGESLAQRLRVKPLTLEQLRWVAGHVEQVAPQLLG